MPIIHGFLWSNLRVSVMYAWELLTSIISKKNAIYSRSSALTFKFPQIWEPYPMSAVNLIEVKIPWLPAGGGSRTMMTTLALRGSDNQMPRCITSFHHWRYIIGFCAGIWSENICNQQGFVTGVPGGVALTSCRLHWYPITFTASRKISTWASAGIIRF